MTLKKNTSIAVLMAVLIGCVGGPTLNVAGLQVTQIDREKIDKLPKEIYQGKDWNVGVIEFENTTGIGPVRSTFSSYERDHSYVRGGVAGIVATPAGVGVGHVSAGTSKTTGSSTVNQTEIIPKIGNMAANAAEEVLLSLGGVKVFSRTSLSKIFDEQKLQASGMVNESTMVNLGKLAGLTHIITGSINNVRTEYGVSTGSMGASIAMQLATGRSTQQTPRWRVDVDATIKIISVETGKVEFSKSFTAVDTADGSKAENRPDFFLGIAQKALKEAMTRSQYELATKFPLRAYIQQMKGGKMAVLLNSGSQQGIKQGDTFFAYDFEAIEDPVTNEKKLSKFKIAEIKVSDQVTENSAWCVSDEKTRSGLKLGMLVEKAVIESGFEKFKKGTEFLR